MYSSFAHLCIFILFCFGLSACLLFCFLFLFLFFVLFFIFLFTLNVRRLSIAK